MSIFSEQFVADTIGLGSIGDPEGYDLTVEFGSLRDRLHYSRPFELLGAELGELSFDYRYYLRAGFEVDFFATAGDVNVVAPLVVDVDAPVTVGTGEAIEINTDDWAFGETIVMASGPSFDIGVDWVTEYFLSTTNERLSLPGGDVLPALPDIFAMPGYSDPGIAPLRHTLFELDSETQPSTSFDIGIVTFEAALPTLGGAVTNGPDDYMADGSVRADWISDPIFSASFALTDVLKSFKHPFAVLMGELLNGEMSVDESILGRVLGIFSDAEWSLDWTLLEMDVVASLRLVTEYVFVPDAVQVTATETGGLGSQTGEIGDTLTFTAPNVADQLEFDMSYQLGGTLQARYGVAPALQFPYEVLSFELSSSEGTTYATDPVAQGNLPYEPWVGAPIWIYDTAPVPVSFDPLTATVYTDVLATPDPGGGGGPPALPVIASIGDAIAVEGGTLEFQVTLSEAAPQVVSIAYETQSFSAEPGDYAPDRGTLRIAAGQSQGVISIASGQDADFDDETFSLTLTQAAGAIRGNDVTALGQIVDDDTPPPDPGGEPPDPGGEPPVDRPVLVGVFNDTVNEGHELSMEVRLDRVAESDVGVVYQILPGTAEPGDYGFASARTTIAAGQSAVHVDIPTYIDGDGDDERLSLRVLSLNGADLGPDVSGTGTIRDIYEAPPTLPRLVGFEDASGEEPGIVEFTLSLDAPAVNTVSVPFGIEQLTAETDDYYPIGGYSTSIQAGETTGTIRIQTSPDNDSRDETFRIDLGEVTNVAGVDVSSAIGTIVDTTISDLPQVVIGGSHTVTEGWDINIPVSLDYNPRNKTVTFDVEITSGTAQAGSDFVARSYSLSLASDDTHLLISLDTMEDALIEGDETVNVVVSNVVGGIGPGGPVTITIEDDDTGAGPGFFFHGPAGTFHDVGPVAEGGQLYFDLCGISGVNYGDLGADVTLNYTVAGVDPSDVVSVTSHFIDSSSSIRTQVFDGPTGYLPVSAYYFPRSQTDQYFYVTAQLADDAAYTGDRDGFLDVEPGFTNGQVVQLPDFLDHTAFTIVENDAPPPPAAFLGDAGGQEGDPLSVVVLLERPVDSETTITYQITAPARFGSGDFAATSGTITVSAGEVTGTAQIDIAEDILLEGPELFQIELTGVTAGAADLVGTLARLVIADDDGFTQGDDIVGLVETGALVTYDALGGHDDVTGSGAREIIAGGAGNDTLAGAGGADTIRGDAGRDSILGGSGGDRLLGGEGADTVNGGGGADEVYLGAGSDVYGDNGQSDAAGRDTVYAGSGNDSIDGGGGNDRLYGQEGDDAIRGGSGNDVIRGGANYDRLFGGTGNDVVWGDDGRDLAYLGAGDDLFEDNAQNDQHGRDTVFGGDGADTVNGGGGNDLIAGNAGDDLLRGGEGRDTISGGEGADRLFGDHGDDEVSGGDGRDIAYLGAGQDLFLDGAQGGADGRDTVYAGTGNDTIDGGGGNDLFHGQDGDDLIRGGPGNDVLHGGANNDQLLGGTGNDTVQGDDGRDLAYLGAGDDVFHDNAQGGVHGRDTVYGGTGHDSINGGGGNDVFWGQGGNDLIKGGAGSDAIRGGGGYDRVLAGTGDDRVWGDGGSDTVYLGAGSDVFHDNAQNDASGADTVYGGEGEDTLHGGGGANVFFGGPGADVFHFSAGVSTGRTVVQDYDTGTDVVALQGLAYADLTVTGRTGGSEVDWGSGSLFLAGVSAGAIDAAFFGFL